MNPKASPLAMLNVNGIVTIVKNAGTGGHDCVVGDPKELIALFDKHRALLIEAVKKADVATLDGPAPFTRPMFTTVAEMINFFGVHTGMHAGQITTIRRSLGRPPIV